MAKKRCLMIGAGGMAGNWVRTMLPRFIDRLEVVALVDVQRDVLESAGDFLQLPAAARFADMRAAFASVDADFCAIVIPPAFHRDAAVLAAERGLHILSEKPIADTWEASLDIYRAVKHAGVKMAVIQNYRYIAPLLTFRQVLREERLGRLNYLVGRFAADYRKYGAWGAFRHDIPHALLVDGAVHHFDMLRNLSGSECQMLSGWEWNPAWGQSKGEFNDLYGMRMANGVYASYEGSGTAAGIQNTWHREYYRAECERGAIVVDADRTVRLHQYTPGQGLRTEEVPPVKVEYEGHLWLIDAFLSWLDDGPVPETVVDDNLKSVAMVFAAIEASRTNQSVDVAAMVRTATAG
ncbi:MAG TPA: Gfo/Idh/MocA family oxidoreductase [Chloroflexota bacterium]|nr:Gfo/Idh/MocA family oxidoreductase [Chloroflexota bacterium]